MIDTWIDRASLVGSGENISKAVNEVFTAVLSYIDVTNCHGACHSTSAALHILLKERGIESVTKIGEVFANTCHFDHSWIEIDGAIYDAAVAYPDPRGGHVGGPIFCGIDLTDYAPHTHKYGAGSSGGLDDPARQISVLSFGAYFAWADQENTKSALFYSLPEPLRLWDMVALVGSTCGVHKTPEQLASTHFETRRQIAFR